MTRRQQKQAVQRYHVLRQEVQQMPRDMAVHMLLSLDRQTIITGAYGQDGGRCPLYAAFRVGTIQAGSSFPRSWDIFCGLKKPWKQKRVCTEHEVRTLRMLLEERLMPREERGSQPDSTPAVVPPLPQPTRTPEPVVQEQWSCDWEAALAALAAREEPRPAPAPQADSNVAVLTRPRVGFVRARRLAR